MKHRPNHSYIGKRRTGHTVSTDTFGLVVIKFPVLPSMEAKDTVGVSLGLADGNTLHRIGGPKYKAYDITVTYGYRGLPGTGARAMLSFVSFLSGRDARSGILMRMTDGTSGVTLDGARFVSFKPAIMHTNNDNDVYTSDITYRICAPVPLAASYALGDDDVSLPDIDITPVDAVHDLAIGYVDDNGADKYIAGSLADMNLVLVSMDTLPEIKAKDPLVNDWLYEDGEQIYDGGELMLDAMTLSVEVGAEKPDDVWAAIASLRDKGVTNLFIIDKRYMIRYDGCHVSKMEPSMVGKTTRGDMTSVVRLSIHANGYRLW